MVSPVSLGSQACGQEATPGRNAGARVHSCCGGGNAASSSGGDGACGGGGAHDRRRRRLLASIGIHGEVSESIGIASEDSSI